MKESDPVLKELSRIGKDVKELKGMLTQETEVWLSESQAAELACMTPENLRKLRYKGKVGKWRMRESGRGIQYLKSDIQNLFIKQ